MAEERSIGVVGLGETGRELCRRLMQAGKHITVYDLDADVRRAYPVTSPQSRLAPSLTDLGADCDVVVSALADATQLRAAAIGDEDRQGFALAMRPGSVIAHFGMGPYKDILRLTGQLGSGGIGLVDVMSCGALDGSETTRALDMLVGGHADVIDTARAALDALGSVTRVGATGTATGLASLRGYVRAARLIALSEAMLIGRHAGIAPDMLARVFDGPVASGPQCRALTGAQSAPLPPHDLQSTCRAVSDAVRFSEHIGVSGECVAFARDMLADAIVGDGGDDESTLLRHFTSMAAADG